MIILYVPFPKENAGDLTNSLEIWLKNHRLNHFSSIRIVYHNEQFALDTAGESLEIYVCAHGDNFEEIIGNHIDEDSASLINTTALAARFNDDFYPCSASIDVIHLYICGNKEKNRNLAATFKSYLSDLATRTVYYYHGSLYGADAEGSLFGFHKRRKLPIDQLKLTAPDHNMPFAKNTRIPIKEQSFLTFLEQVEERKRNQVAKTQKEKRVVFFTRLRAERSQNSAQTALRCTVNT